MSLYTQDFNVADTVNTLPALKFGTRTLSWIQIKGVWRVLNNKAYTSESASNNPITVVNTLNSRFEFEVELGSGGCVYFRVKDDRNWYRLRYRRHRTRDYDYIWFAKFEAVNSYDGGLGVINHSHYDAIDAPAGEYTGSNSSFCPAPDTRLHTHDISSGGIIYYNRTHSHGKTFCVYDRRVATGYNYYYYIYLEKSVGGSISTLATRSTSASKIKIFHLATGFDVFLNGSSTKDSTLSKVDSTDGLATLVGFGMGPTDYAVSPYFDNAKLETFNVSPDVPTLLKRQYQNTDRTPHFSCHISDPNASQLIKARFYIYQSDGTTLIGTTDSIFLQGAHAASAEYRSSLPLGNYKVRAQALDDQGLSSALTAPVDFQVTAPVILPNKTLKWSVKPYILKDSTLLWNITENNVANFTLKWNVAQLVVVDRSLLWHQKTPWFDTLISPSSLWEEVYLREREQPIQELEGLVTEFVEATV